MKKNFMNLIVKSLLICMIAGVVNLGEFKIEAKAAGIQEQKDNLIEEILKKKPEVFGKILRNPDKYQVQILYTQIDRGENNVPSFRTFKYRVDKDKYFYPASSVKLSACVLALEKLNNLGIDKDTPLKIEKARPSQKSVYKDYSSQSKMPTIGNYIKKVFVVSDNDGFDRLYEFLGQEYYNETLWKKGYTDTLILHRLGNPMNYEENRYTNPFEFYKGDKVIYSQPMAYGQKAYTNKIRDTKKGKGYKSGGRHINGPKDFSKSNYFSIECLQGILKAVMFPEAVPEKRRFNLKKEDYEFLRKYMCMLPKECDNPKYNFKDSHVKYFMFGDTSKSIPKNMKIYNKIGCAYGYLVDNAYIVDESKGIEFLLTSVIYSNENDIFNDGKYEYYKVGMPFLANLGREIYKYEENGRKI
ncbi:serine hydrolase [Clostridium ganghwense]|uniref:Serine hydrolase n=1 Tax=Clostridium ganghwense TaxID=312089 RepID=A0ABT4CP78_9CLOT|nr:serine hydrolase [Clostridium ganghwense]MCY6370864.1 serine hydrolase [Clostridium ganghwense]